MSLGTPWMLLLLPLVPLAGWLMARSRRLQREAACRLKGVAPENGRFGLGRGEWLALGALVCIVVALARPQWSPRPYDIERRGRDIVIALDVSRSMLAADVFPSRLEMARIAIHEALPAWNGQRMALVTFAGSATVRVPLTLDHGFVRYMLERADPSDEDVGGTSLQAAVQIITNSVLTDAAGGHRDLIVFTDGEDHLSDIGKTAELLSQCGARVLMVGLGDPVRGARVPDPRADDRWMRHNNVDVVSRLDATTLTELADQASNVTYFPARTRPFDLVPLYQQLIADAEDDIVVGGLRQVRYTEGYPYLLALAVAFCLASASWRLPNKRHQALLILLALLVPGCASHVEENGEAVFRARTKQGSELLRFAQEQSDADALAERSLLVDAREQFLRAALLRPGQIEIARRITKITRRLHVLDTLIEQQRAEEKQRREKLAETIGRLERLTGRQKRLAQQSLRVLSRRAVPTGEEANVPEFSGTTQKTLDRLAPAVATEQRAVRVRTSRVLDSVTLQRDALREFLTHAYGDVARLPATEVDPVVDLLAGTVAAQDEALTHLARGAVQWPRANTTLHTAAGRMQQALDALRSLQPPATDQEDNTMTSRNTGDVDETMEELESESLDNRSQPVSPGDFQEALLLRTLPVPDYTPAEILAEEAANQQKRSRRKAVRAGAKVEKNW